MTGYFLYDVYAGNCISVVEDIFFNEEDAKFVAHEMNDDAGEVYGYESHNVDVHVGTGMIISGFPAIGKSSVSGMNFVVDLESSNFFVDGKRPEDWVKIYCNIAEHLKSQGYIVMVSSHGLVRQELNNRGVEFTAVYPSLKIKDQWLQRLKNRYDNDSSDKNLRAYERAVGYYEQDVQDMMKEKKIFEIYENLEHFNLISVIDKIVEDGRRSRRKFVQI